jgi:hypothetical protein
MTNQDGVRFIELLTALAETFDETLSDLRAEIYFRTLVDLELAQVEQAIVRAARTLTFFPKPAELRALVEGTPEDRAEMAWMQLLQQVRRVGSWGTPAFTDPIIARAIGDLFGGWKALCERLPGDGPELLGWAKQFKTVYSVYEKRPLLDRALPAGITPRLLQ